MQIQISSDWRPFYNPLDLYDKAVTTSGYPADRNQWLVDAGNQQAAQMYSASGKIENIYDGYVSLSSTLDMDHGQSGSPLFWNGPDGNFIVGTLSYQWPLTGGGFENRAVVYSPEDVRKIVKAIEPTESENDVKELPFNYFQGTTGTDSILV